MADQLLRCVARLYGLSALSSRPTVLRNYPQSTNKTLSGVGPTFMFCPESN